MGADILVFRESISQLVKRFGLQDGKIDYRDQDKFDVKNSRQNYNIALRGPSDSSLNVGAITRATGYMASARVPITDASKKQGGMLSVNIPPLEMTPHNLTVWAEWYYSIANGATTGII